MSKNDLTDWKRLALQKLHISANAAFGGLHISIMQSFMENEMAWAFLQVMTSPYK